MQTSEGWDTLALTFKAVTLTIHRIKEIMMVLGSHTSRTVVKMFRKVFPHLLLTLRSSPLSGVKVSSTMAAHQAILPATETQRSCIALPIGLAASSAIATIARKLNVATVDAWALSLLVRADSHLPLKCIVETDTVCHVLVLRVAELTVKLVRLALFEKHNLIRIVWSLDNSREMHRIVNLILGLQNLFEAEIVVTFLESVKRDVLVVPIVDVLGVCTGHRIRQRRLVSLGRLHLSNLGSSQVEVILQVHFVVACAVSHFYYYRCFKRIEYF